MFEIRFSRIKDLLSRERPGEVYEEEIEPVAQNGDYEIGYRYYGKFRDCVYIKNTKTNKIETEIPVDYMDGLPKGSIYYHGVAFIKKVFDNGMVLVGQGEMIQGPHIPRREHYLIDLKNNKVLDEKIDNLEYAYAEREAKNNSKARFLVDSLANLGYVCLEDNYVFNVEGNKKYYVDPKLDLYGELYIGQQNQKSNGLLYLSEFKNGERKKYVLNLDNGNLYDRELISKYNISQNLLAIDNIPDELLLLLKDDLKKFLLSTLDLLKEVGEKVDEPVEPKKPLIMTKSKREEYNHDYNKYLENKQEYNLYKSRVEKYEESKKIVKEHFTDRLEKLNKENAKQKDNDGRMA